MTLFAPQRVDDGGGGGAITYAEIATVWADVKTGGAAQAAIADDLATRKPVEIRIRHRDDVRAGWRAAEGGRTFRVIAAVDPDSARRWLSLACEQEVI